ncbi:hypothetical protein AB205_0001430, partial [Aquarana catesbeiana]
FNREAPKNEATVKPPEGAKGGYPRSGPNRGGNKAIFPLKTECGHLTQDVGLEAWDLTPGPSTDPSVVDVKSPDSSCTLGQCDPEEEASIREPLVCASHDLHRCTIG